MSETYDHLRPFAERYSFDNSKKGTVHLAACPCCGNVTWATSSKTPETELKIVVTESSDLSRCKPCQFVMQRSPEIFDWVNAVVQRQIEVAMAAHNAHPTDAKP